MDHVAFLTPKYLRQIASGQKRWEFRLSQFSPPWMKVKRGDRLFLKRVSGDIELVAYVGDLLKFPPVGDSSLMSLDDFIRCAIRLDASSADYMKSKPLARFGLIAELCDVLKIDASDLPPPPFGVRMGWVADW